MVIIFSKTLEKKKNVNDVRSKDAESLLCGLHAMSGGSSLLSCGAVEAERWLDLGCGGSIQRAPAPCQSAASLVGVWRSLPEQCQQQRSRGWVREGGPAKAITSLIRDLSLVDRSLGNPLTHIPSTPTTPPSKRQCRSLSLSEEFGGGRSPWRPQGSRVWRAVEKRRCLSGGSVQPGPGGAPFPAMQRSSSLSEPTEGVLEMACFTQGLPLHPLFTACSVAPASPPSHLHSLRPLSLSHEHISLLELHTEEQSEDSSPDSTPELRRRCGQKAGGVGGLSRSRSQPCVGNHRRIGMKRRRPEEATEARPSLDLVKMTQKLQTSHSLSWPGTSAYDTSQPNQGPQHVNQSDSDFISVCDLQLAARQEVIGDEEDEEEDWSYEDVEDSDSVLGSPWGDRPPLWKEQTNAHMFQLGGGLDLEQIERN